MHIDSQIVTLIFTIVTGLGVLFQALVLFAIFMALRKTQTKLHGVTERLEDVVIPLVTTSRSLVEDLSPKLKLITSNLVSASDTLRKQAENVGGVVSDVTARTHKQTARVDSMLASTLDSIGSATAAIEKNLAGPLRQVNGVLAGFRAGVEKLRTNPPAARQPIRRPAQAAPTYPSTSTAPIYAQPVDHSPADITPEEAREAAARFVRDRAAAERR